MRLHSPRLRGRPNPLGLGRHVRFCLRLGLQTAVVAASAAASEDPWLASSPDPFVVPAGLWLGLSGGYARSGDERSRSFAAVELGIGFEVLGGDSGDVAALANEAGAAAGIESPGPWSEARNEPAMQPAMQPAQSGARASSGPRCTDAQPCSGALSQHVSPLLARAAVAAALRVLGSGGELRRLASMATRSRAAASLPEVRLGAGTSQDESLRLTPTLADPARFTRDGGRDLWLEARLTWRLDSALFSKDEIAIERLKAEHREARARVTREVLEALLDWQRAGVTLRTEHLLPEERDAALVRELGAVARLDVATAGWFSRYLERRRGAPAGPPRP